MNRAQLAHVIRAAARIAGESEIVVVGSQAVLGEHPAAPAELLESMEADIYPREHPERADLIDGATGGLVHPHGRHRRLLIPEPCLCRPRADAGAQQKVALRFIEREGVVPRTEQAAKVTGLPTHRDLLASALRSGVWAEERV